MSAPKNIQRDGWYLDPNGTEYSFPTAVSIAGSPVMSGPSAAAVDYAEAANNAVSGVTIGADKESAIGVLMDPPSVDRVPYRIKASVEIPNVGDPKTFICIGYAPASPTGSGDVITGARYIHFTEDFDDLVIVEPEKEGETYYGRALVIALLLRAENAFTDKKVVARLSVQSLAVKPPTMQNAVS